MADDSTEQAPGMTRRDLGGLAVGAGVLAGIAGTATPAAAEPAAVPERPAARRPNFLFILTDDLGWGDLSSYGAPGYPTPEIDGLARDGLSFTDAYAGSCVCSPTRISLYTGRYPGRLRGGLYEPIAAPTADAGLPPDQPTLASLLSAAGYETAMFGKWNAGFLPWFGPVKSGWAEFFGNYGPALDYFSHRGYAGDGPDLYEGEKAADRPGYYTDLLTDRAVEFIRRGHDRPWLLDLNFNAPHWPWEGPGDKAESDRLMGEVDAGKKTLSEALNHRDGGSVHVYQRMLTSIDRSVGRVLDALRHTGQERDTIVVFTSDNGGERFSYLWPLRDRKGTLYEGGIRVPCIVRWPGVVSRGRRSDVPLFTPDLTATLVDIAGTRAGADHPFDGVSLAPYLRGGAAPRERDLFWRTREQGAIRRGRWKFVRTHGSGGDTDELYDLVSDPSEQANLAARKPGTLAGLRDSWTRTDAELVPYT